MTEAPPVLVEGWMRSDGDGAVALLARRCSACGWCSWPPRAACPACASADLVDTELSGAASLHAVTVDRLGGLLGRPHLVGQAQMAEGTFVQGYVDAPVEEPPRVGTPLTVVAFELPWAGETALTYAFRPVEDTDA